MPSPLLENHQIPGNPELHCVRWSSSGEPLLLLHGMGGNVYWWEKTSPYLAKHFQTAALDFRGHGDSDWAADGHYTLNVFLEDIERVRKHFKWKRMNIAAHSLGARIALDYAARSPNKVRRLVVVDFLPEFRRAISQKFSFMALAKQPVYHDVQAMISRFRLEPRATFLKEQPLKELAMHCIRKTENGYTWKFDWRCFGMHYDPAWSVFPTLRIPVLVVRGAQSALMTAGIYKKIVEAIPNARGAEIPNAHHHVPLDAPDTLAARMLDFLSDP